FSLENGQPVPSTSTLLVALSSYGHRDTTPELRHELRNQFSNLADARTQREAKAAEDRRAANISSLTEEIRQLLVEAAYVELALAANRDLFDDPLPLDFSEQAFQRLKRHKVPFAGA